MKTRLIVTSFIVPFALAACAGGGGGSSTPAPAPAPAPSPAPLPVTSSGVSISANYGPGVPAGSRVLTSAPTTDTTASLTTVGTVGRSGSTSTVTSATINSTNASGAGGSALTVNQSVQNSVNGFVASSTAPNNITGNTSTQPLGGGTLTQYLYTTFGAWADCAINCNSANETGVAGWYVYGQETPASVIAAKTGSATYSGTLNGNYIDGTATAYAVRASLTATAYFDAATPGHAARSIDFITTDSNILPIAPGGGGVGAPAPDGTLNITGTLNIGAGGNQFSGNLTDGGGRTGTATGRFFGPAASEIGGVYSLTNGTQTNIGSFVAK